MLHALLASVLLHVALIFAIAWILSSRHANFFQPITIPSIPEEITITMIEPPPVAVSQDRRFAEANPAQEIAKPVENATFESDRNTRAASQEAPEGTLPLPTQQGIEMPVVSVINQQYTEGEHRTDNALPSVPQSQQQATQAPRPKPEIKPRESQLTLLQPTAALPSQPQVITAPRPEGYRPERRVTRIKGGIGTAGASSVATASTPFGRYQQELADAIGKKWHPYVRREISFLNPGTAEFRFTVLPSGKVERIQLLHNTSNRSFEIICSKAIADAVVPPIPEDLIPVLDDGCIEVDYTFTILPH